MRKKELVPGNPPRPQRDSQHLVTPVQLWGHRHTFLGMAQVSSPFPQLWQDSPSSSSHTSERQPQIPLGFPACATMAVKVGEQPVSPQRRDRRMGKGL